MQQMHQFVRKAVSLLITLLLIVAILSSCSAATDTFTYDANGNMVSGSGLSLVYNDANQLIEVINESDSSTVAEYFYDSNGQRVKKIENGIATYYIGDYLETRIHGGNVDNTCYYFANNERVARKDSDGSKYYYHGDHLGSTSVVSDEAGALSEKVSYYPYGSVKEQVGEGSTYLFTDQEFDDESGLYYYGARYYNPELTRFTQPDTITQDVYNPQNLNRYSYVLNNPLKYTDPSGLEIIIGGVLVLLFGSLVYHGIKYQYEYCKNNPVDPSDLGALLNIEVEGAKGMVVASIGYLTGKIFTAMGFDQPLSFLAGRAGAYIGGKILPPAGKKESNVEPIKRGDDIGGKPTPPPPDPTPPVPTGKDDSFIGDSTRGTLGSHAKLVGGGAREREYHLYPATGPYQVQVSPESISYACERSANKTMPRFSKGGF